MKTKNLLLISVCLTTLLLVIACPIPGNQNYTVTFDKNDVAATGIMTPQTITGGTSAKLTFCGFTKAGAAFGGWAATPTGTVAYANGANYTMGSANVTLYAKWIANGYTVTFDKNDTAATGSMPPQIIVNGSSANLTVCAFTKAGWTFAGWAATPTGTVAYTDGASFTMGSANVTLYAIWTANNYTITFDKNDSGATGIMAPQTIASGSSANLSACGFTKSGWNFAGWATSATGSVAYGNGVSFTMGASAVTLYALWVANGFTITFDKNDVAAAGTMTPQVISSGSTAALFACTYAKTGWSFSGWATTPTGTVAYANGASYTMGSVDVTLYAKWAANNYTITFDKNDSGATGTLAPQTIASGSSANLSTCAFTKTGWTFAGWAVTSNGVVAYANGASYTMGTANVTLYARWTANNYSITFDKNDTAATGTMANQVIACGSSANLTACGFTKTGWTFAGWATTSAGAVVYGDGASYTMGSSNVTLYAKWTVTTRTVTFDSQGGSTVTPQTIAYGSPATEPSVPTWTGHALEGWFREPGCTNRWNFGSDTVTANVTLYAKWLVCTEGLAYTLINGNTGYSVTNGSANTLGIIIPEYWAGKKVISIGTSGFEYRTYITSLTLPNGLISIGDYAFHDCSSLTSLTLPSGVTSIGTSAFEGCSGLTSLTIPSSVTSIGDKTFYHCSGLTSLTIPSGVTSIGTSVFYGCGGLTSLTLPNGLISIGDYAFGNCTGLTTLTIPSGVTSIGYDAFINCTGLTSLTIPSGVTSIGNCAFSYCSNLASVTVNPTSPPTAGTTIFLYSSNLTAIYVPASSVTAYQAAAGWSIYSALIVSQ